MEQCWFAISRGLPALDTTAGCRQCCIETCRWRSNGPARHRSAKQLWRCRADSSNQALHSAPRSSEAKAEKGKPEKLQNSSGSDKGTDRWKHLASCVSEPSYNQDLSTALDRLSELVPGPQAQEQEARGLRSELGKVSGSTVRCRGRPVHRELCKSKCLVPPTGVEAQEQFEQKPTGVERLASFESTEESNAFPLRSGSTVGSQCGKTRSFRDWVGPSSQFHALPEARRVFEDSSLRSGEAREEGRTSLQELGRCPASCRRRHSIEDCAVGRGSGLGFAVSTIPRESIGCETSVETAAGFRQGLCGHSEGGKQLHGGAVEVREVGGVKASTHVSPQTRRSFTRAGKQVETHPRGAVTGQMGKHSQPQELRKRVPTQPAIWGSTRTKATAMPAGPRSSRVSFPQPALDPQVSLQPSVFLEIFSGSGRLAKAVGRECNWPVLLWDISLGANYDLTKQRNQQLILGWMRSGVVKAGHLGTPCNSFSRARDQPGGPPPLRSDRQPLGLDDLLPHDALKVQIGNQLMRFTARVLQLALILQIFFTLENPARSRLWICPPILAVMRRKHVVVQLVEYCMFGMPWRKSTKFLGVHLNLDILGPYRCIGSKRGLCKRSNLPHLPLAGQDSNGHWRTKTAEPYPHKLCKLLARCFDNADTQRIADNFQHHLLPTALPVG